MVFKQFVAGVGAMLLASSVVMGGGGDQPQAARPALERDQHVQARYNIVVMEGVLERAVQHGADQLRRQVRRVMPDMLLISGTAGARGLRLEGYGVFFDVEVPMMRQSMAWSLKSIMDENGVAAAEALRQIRTAIERLTPDAHEKAALMQAIKRLEIQVSPLPALGGGAARPMAQRGQVTSMEALPTQTPVAQPPGEEIKLIEDPSAAYEKEIISALIDAMLDHSGPIGVGPDEWLTVAARDNEQRDRLVPGDAYDLLTIVLRVKGSDLAAFRADRITREEARKRVERREF
jgi:hypothetical protein